MIGGCFMSKNNKIFNQVLDIINPRIGKIIRNPNYKYKYAKKYEVKDYIFSMLFLQLSESKGLRDFDSKYRGYPKSKADFKQPSYSQLSRLNNKDHIDIFQDIFNYTLSIAQKEIKSNIAIKSFKDIKAIDSSVVNIGKALCPSLYFGDEKSAIRISTLYSCGTELPNKINIVHAKVGERTCIEGFDSDSNVIYTFDKGYYKYSWYDEMTDNNIKFVTRLAANAQTEQIKCRYTGIENLYDLTVTLGTDYSKNKTKHNYREIESFNTKTGEEFRLITNIYDMSAKDLLSLYSKRWEIETFFKWIKQHLTIKHWVGHSENAISTQIYSALIIYILVLIIKNRLKITYSKYNVLRKIRANLFEIYDLREIFLR